MGLFVNLIDKVTLIYNFFIKNMAEITINSKKHGKKIVLVDDEDYDYLNQFKWYINHFDYVESKITENNEKTKIMLHRIIMKVPKNTRVIHLNGNKLDNRKINLKKCTYQEIAFKRRAKKTSKSQYKGVAFDKETNTWTSRITINAGKKNQFTVYSGRCNTPEEAAIKYNEMVLEYYNGYAYLNEAEFTGHLTKQRISNSGFKNISYCVKQDNYRVCMMKDGLTFNVGTFKSLEEAKAAYNIKAKELYGDKAQLYPTTFQGIPEKRKVKNPHIEKYIQKRQHRHTISYIVNLNHNGQRLYLGSYNTLEEAIKVRDTKQQELSQHTPNGIKN